MKKNAEYVGVDEKFIPENEKYVDESLLGDKEKSKKTAKKIAKGYLIFFIIFVIFTFSIPIFMFIYGKKQVDNMYNKTFAVSLNNTDSYNQTINKVIIKDIK